MSFELISHLLLVIHHQIPHFFATVFVVQVLYYRYETFLVALKVLTIPRVNIYQMSSKAVKGKTLENAIMRVKAMYLFHL
jgi:hypothetical protein